MFRQLSDLYINTKLTGGDIPVAINNIANNMMPLYDRADDVFTNVAARPYNFEPVRLPASQRRIVVRARLDLILQNMDKRANKFINANGLPDLAGKDAFKAKVISQLRANVIGMTETVRTGNEASAHVWRKNEVTHVDIFDGVGCGWTAHNDPDSADGSIRTIEEFNDYPTAHPNCQRVGTPIIET